MVAESRSRSRLLVGFTCAAVLCAAAFAAFVFCSALGEYLEVTDEVAIENVRDRTVAVDSPTGVGAAQGAEAIKGGTTRRGDGASAIYDSSGGGTPLDVYDEETALPGDADRNEDAAQESGSSGHANDSSHDTSDSELPLDVIE